MTRWIDTSASDTDIFDRVLVLSENLFKNNFATIVKIFPALLGFGIFLSYFYQNKFYPSFDLFQFSSLLLSAAILGFIIVSAITLGLMSPGFLTFHGFMNKKAIKEDIQYSLPYTENPRISAIFQFVGLCYFLPLISSSIIIAATILKLTGLYVFTFFSTPFLICLFTGIALQYRFKLPKFSFLYYIWAGYFPILIVNALGSYMMVHSAPILEKIENESLAIVAFMAIPIAISILASLCSMVYFVSWKVSLHMSALFALLIAGYSGILTSLPKKTMQHLGLGNYTAELIILTPEYCDADTVKHLTIEDCALRNVKVIWSFGENFVFKRADEDKRLLQIPAHFVKAIIKPVT